MRKRKILSIALLLAAGAPMSVAGAQGPTSPAAGARVFAPGIVSTAAADAAITFTADGREAFFERGNGPRSIIMTTRHGAKGWSAPVVAPFSGRWLDLEPALAPDGSFLIFVSNRPVGTDGIPIDGFYYGKAQVGKGGALWRVDRIGAGWGTPYRLSGSVNGDPVHGGTSNYEPSVAANGDLYFQRADPDGRRFRLYVAKREGSGYRDAQPIDLAGDAKASDMDPAIARDGSYLLFASDRGAAVNRLFIAFRTGEGWTRPVRLGEDVVGSGVIGDPRIGPELDRLYFSSRQVAPASGDPGKDAEAIRIWNSGLPNIWSVPFHPAAWREAAERAAQSPTPPRPS